MRNRWSVRLLRWWLLVVGIAGGLGGMERAFGQGLPAPVYEANFAWSAEAGAVVQASTNTAITCTVDVYLTGDPYQPLPTAVGCVPSIVGAGGSVTVITNVDYSPWWAQYVCVFTPSDPGYLTLKVDVGANSASRAVTAARLKEIVFSPDQVIAVSNSVTMTAVVEPAGFAGTFAWSGAVETNGPTVTATLDYGGHIPAWVTLVETGETLGTEVVVISPTLTVFAKDNPGTVGEATGFGVLVENDDGISHTVTWTGAATGAGDSITYTPTDPGTKTATATGTVGPWTGAASADQKVFSFGITVEPDAEGNVVNTYQVNGPDGVCFLASARFPGQYEESQQWVGVGTSLLIMDQPAYDADSFTDTTPDPNGAPCAPSLALPNAPDNGSAAVVAGGPEAKIEGGKGIKTVVEGTVKAVVEVFVDEIKKLVVKSISDITITIPPSLTTTNYLIAQYYPAGSESPFDVRSDAIVTTVGCSGSTFTAKRVAAWNHLVIDGNFIVQTTVTPKDVFVNHIGGMRSPLTGNVKVSSCLDDPTRGVSPTYGGIFHAFAGRQSSGTAFLNNWVVIGGKTLPRTFSCYGILEFLPGTPFDALQPPHVWVATTGDSLTTSRVNITLTP